MSTSLTRCNTAEWQTVLPNEVIAQSIVIHDYKPQNVHFREESMELEGLVPLRIEAIVVYHFCPISNRNSVV